MSSLVDKLRRHADDYSQMLQKPGFRPSRGHLEDARNLLRQAAKALEEQPPKRPPILTGDEDDFEVVE